MTTDKHIIDFENMKDEKFPIIIRYLDMDDDLKKFIHDSNLRWTWCDKRLLENDFASGLIFKNTVLRFSKFTGIDYRTYPPFMDDEMMDIVNFKKLIGYIEQDHLPNVGDMTA